MHARDAAGRQVSLLNDDRSSYAPAVPHRPMSYHSSSYGFAQAYPGSAASSPNTPELLRSDSYDSQMSNDPISPLTPNVDYYPRQSVYSIPHDYNSDVKRSAYPESSRSASYDDDLSNPPATSPVPERPGKRYPCRYRDTHGCEKTFTTSGHASRHSKIHTAEKAVQCTYPGCQKKFTRADNMKQHLETHYKDKSRSSSSRAAQKAALAESRRNSTGCPSSRSVSSRDTEQYPLPAAPLRSPNVDSERWNMRGLPLLNRPVAGRTPSGLDTLAMAIACQEGA